MRGRRASSYVVARSRSGAAPDDPTRAGCDGGLTVIAEAQIETDRPVRPGLRLVPRPPQLDLGDAAELWQRSLDAAERAFAAGARVLPAASIRASMRALTGERRATEELLARAAREIGSPITPWLSPVPIDPRMLGLPRRVRACLFDVEGVLTDSGSLHAWAWREVLDPLLLRFGERAGWAFRPFDPVEDYRDFLDGRPRLEGIHMFLASRGIRLPEGRADDPTDADTAYGLARRKGERLAQALVRRRMTALPGARRYLEASRRAGLACAAVSASTTTLPVLERAGLERLVDERADAELMAAEGLRARPAPDLLLASCRRLGVAPSHAVTLTHTAAGVAAGRSAGVHVIGVGRGTRGEELRGFGADAVVAALDELLDPRLRER
jgi:HAD superfamily hydrolase (TIGR01509 family)